MCPMRCVDTVPLCANGSHFMMPFSVHYCSQTHGFKNVSLGNVLSARNSNERVRETLQMRHFRSLWCVSSGRLSQC